MPGAEKLSPPGLFRSAQRIESPLMNINYRGFDADADSSGRRFLAADPPIRSLSQTVSYEAYVIFCRTPSLDRTPGFGRVVSTQPEFAC